MVTFTFHTFYLNNVVQMQRSVNGLIATKITIIQIRVFMFWQFKSPGKQDFWI